MKPTIKEINYHRIAKLAERNGANFERQCKRAEEGAQTEEDLLGSCVRPATFDWLTTPQAAEYLSMTYSTFVSTLMDGELDYFGIRYHSRSRVKTNARRGCGVLYSRADLVEVARIRQVLNSSQIAALRVFQAKGKRGALMTDDETTTPTTSLTLAGVTTDLYDAGKILKQAWDRGEESREIEWEGLVLAVGLAEAALEKVDLFGTVVG